MKNIKLCIIIDRIEDGRKYLAVDNRLKNIEQFYPCTIDETAKTSVENYVMQILHKTYTQKFV